MAIVDHREREPWLALNEGRGPLEAARRLLDRVPRGLMPSLRAEEPSA